MPSKFNIRKTTSDTDGNDDEVLQEDSGVSFPQSNEARDQIRRIQDLMRELGEPVNSIFKDKRVISDARKTIKNPSQSLPQKQSDPTNKAEKNKKPNRRF